MKYNNTDFINELSQKLVTTKEEASNIFTTFVSILKTQIKAGSKIAIQNFGHFEKINKKERLVRNPKTGETITAKPSSVVKFKASVTFKEFLNS